MIFTDQYIQMMSQSPIRKEGKMKCYFSSGIHEMLTCSHHPEFDDLGFPLIDCEDYPCLKWYMLEYRNQVEFTTG